MYYHTVATISGLDPIKVTSYTQVEQDQYIQSLPAGSVIHYVGSSSSEMIRAFRLARNAPGKSDAHIQASIDNRRILKSAQRVCPPSRTHTASEIQAIVDAANWI